MSFSRVLAVPLTACIIAGCTQSPMARGVALPAQRSPVPTHQVPPSPDYWPTAGWQEATAESQGMRSAVLAEALDLARTRGVPIHSLLIIRHGKVVLDAAVYPFAIGSRHDVASITKSVTSVLAGIAAHSGRLSLTEDIAPLVGLRQPTTIENLLAMQSGLECGFGRSELELHAMQHSESWVTFAAALPPRSTAGTEFGYCSPNYHLVSAAIARATQLSEGAFARKVLFAPLGISDVYWPDDPQGVTHGWGDLQLSARDLAKIGFLMLHDGVWDGRSLVPADWTMRSTTAHTQYGARNLYGMGWWSHPDSPHGFYEAIGRGGQRLSIWPEKDLIVVMTGGGYEPGDFSPFLMRALAADSALPPDAAGESNLRAAIAAASTPPAATAVVRESLESSISGRTIRTDANSLGLRSLRLAFDRAGATAHLEVQNRILDLPIGLDGRYRMADQPIDGIRPGARGHWKQPNEFVLELDLIGKIDHYTVSIRLLPNDRVSLDITERTGLMKETIAGSITP